MPRWLLLSLATLLLWGLWGFFIRLSSAQLNFQTVIVCTVAGSIAGLIVMYIAAPAQLTLQGSGVVYGVLSGFAMIVGMMTLSMALSRGGSTGAVVTISALYPLITILLALVFLREPVTLRSGAGMVLALLAMVLMA